MQTNWDIPPLIRSATATVMSLSGKRWRVCGWDRRQPWQTRCRSTVDASQQFWKQSTSYIGEIT